MQLTFAQLSTIVVAATLAACTTTDTTKPAIPKGSVDMGSR